MIATVPMGTPFAVAVTPDGTRAYVTRRFPTASVSVIDTASNTVVATVAVADPEGIAVNAAGTRVYVANNGNSFSVIETAGNTVIATVPMAPRPQGVAVNPAGTRAYVTNFDPPGTNIVSVIDITNNTLVATVPVGFGPNGVSVTPDGTRAYVVSSGSVSVIDTASNTVVATVPVGGGSIGFGLFIGGAATVPPTITNGPPPNGTLGLAYNFAYTSTGCPATFSVTAGGLPPGLTLSPAGVISGTPTTTGTFTGTVTATNGTAPDATQAFSITIAAPPTITNGPPPNGTVGVAYNFAYTSTGSPTFSVTAGGLPPGLTLSPAGVISGTPTTTGTFTGTVTATNGTAPDATQAFSITIAAPAPPAAPTITNGPPPNGTFGVAYNFAYTSTGSPTFSVTAGGLPPGLTLSPAGVISGTPTTAGTFNGTVTATNGAAPDATQAFSIIIAAAIPTLSEWGVIFLVMSLLAAALLKMRLETKRAF